MGKDEAVTVASQRPARRRAQGGRQRASHSLDAVVTEAVALLDEAGEPALTFRALAARLGTGVGSIYWYVSSKDELLDRASDHVLADVLTATAHVGSSADPLDDVRDVAVALFDAIAARPWLGSYFLNNAGFQPNGLMIYERLGQQVLRLDLTPRQLYQGVSAVLGFVVGVAADLGHDAEIAAAAPTLSEAADEWRALDPQTYPFLHAVAEEFSTHVDAELFRAGLDLLLDGLRQQVGRS